ncbi:MAG TPA: Do family serine endopeptidase [Methylomirabilota bacterium]|nr:Do family serine endopeptidase [Methylomirabilota bacterium]
MPTLAPILEKVTPAVVNIAVLQRSPEEQNPLLRDPFFRRFFGGPGQAEPQIAAGSGVIVDAKNGYVMTNAHVVKDAREVLVTLKDNRRLPAKLVGADPGTDIAVVKVDPKNLVDVKLGDSDAMQVGDFVIAIGNPFGLGQTATSGIVSALGRSGLSMEGYEHFIQTDASINPGNSGGPLVNLRGEVIGINTAIVATGQGIGFAIPANMVKRVTAQLIDRGRVQRGWIGVALQPMSAELAQALGLPDTKGAIVARVYPDSPAAAAGLAQNDVIVGFDGTTVDDYHQLQRLSSEAEVGRKVKLDLVRKREKKTVELKVAEAPDTGPSGDTATRPPKRDRER